MKIIGIIIFCIISNFFGWVLTSIVPNIIKDKDNEYFAKVKVFVIGAISLFIFIVIGNFLGCNDDNDGFQSHEIFGR